MPALNLPGHLVTTPQISVRGVIFDMDGLLLDSETLAMEALICAGRDLDCELSRFFCERMIGVPEDGCAALLRDTYGDAFPSERFFALQTEHLRHFIDSGRLAIKPGVVPLLDLLDARHIPRAIATSSGRDRTEDQLRRVSLYDRFDAIVSRDDVTQGKPAPDPYLVAASRIGVDPELCLALEDSTNGAIAALAAGMRVIVVPDLIQPADEVREKVLAIVRDLFVARDYVMRYAR
ncbi:HAD family hydrolase [Asaia platycodi]|uniref:HAD family hydrolase n=1 Tax=Asaia platycodi TaxID=610243 RepID=UPI00046E77DE|nr:HAD family phosphatase [Asaia platycodi]